MDQNAAAPQHTPTKRKGMSRREKIIIAIVSIVSLILIMGMIGKASNSANTSSADSSTPAQTDSNSQDTQAAAANPTPAPQPQVLLDISGKGTKTTQKFTAASDWDLNWSYDCTSYGSQGNFQVIIYNGDGSLSTDNELVNQLGTKDSNVEHYHTGGTFYLVVNSECSWHMTAKG